jgi:serine protease Do
MRPVIDAIARDGRVRRGWIGVTVMPASLRRGALIVQIEEDSPAARAGLEKDDEIVAINGESIRDDQPLRRAIARSPVGTTLSLSVRRNEDEIREIGVTTGERPD